MCSKPNFSFNRGFTISFYFSLQMKSGLHSNVTQSMTAPPGLIRSCVLMMTTPSSSCTPCLSLAPGLHVCWLRGIFWSLQEKQVTLHTIVSSLPGPKQSVAGPVSACAPQTRLNNLPPLCSSFHILTSQTCKVCGMKLAAAQACVSSRCLQWSGRF